MAVNYDFMGRASADAHIAAGAVADAMEALGVDTVSRDVIEHAATTLGDGWDFKSVEACIGNCSFEVYDA